MKSLEELKEEYKSLCHAMQSGVAAKMNVDDSECKPKHLRVGVNSSMVDSSALARLLMRKGIIVEQEYYEILVEVMREEVESYKKFLSDHYGSNINLA